MSALSNKKQQCYTIIQTIRNYLTFFKHSHNCITQHETFAKQKIQRIATSQPLYNTSNKFTNTLKHFTKALQIFTRLYNKKTSQHFSQTIHNSSTRYTLKHNLTQLYNTPHTTTQLYNQLQNHYKKTLHFTQLYTTLRTQAKLYTAWQDFAQLYKTIQNTPVYTTIHNIHNSTHLYKITYKQVRNSSKLYNIHKYTQTRHKLYTTLHSFT
jgi:hypothetical protein